MFRKSNAYYSEYFVVLPGMHRHRTNFGERDKKNTVSPGVTKYEVQKLSTSQASKSTRFSSLFLILVSLLTVNNPRSGDTKFVREYGMMYGAVLE